MEQVTIKNEAGEVWTSGKRGKPPVWVQSHPAYLAYKADKEAETPVTIVKTQIQDIDTKIDTKIENSTSIQYWKWIGVAGEDNIVQGSHQCYVAAFDMKEAIQELNKTFKNFPVSKLEFETCWKKIPGHDMMAKEAGAYQFVGGEVWEKRCSVRN